MLASMFHFNNIFKARIAVRWMFGRTLLHMLWLWLIFFFWLHFYSVEASGRLLCFFIFMSTLWTWAAAGVRHLVNCHLFLFDPGWMDEANELITGVTATDGGGFCLFNQRVSFINSCWDYEQGEKWLGDARADLDWDAQTATRAACGWAALFVCRCALRWVHKADLLTYLCYMLPPEGFDSCWNSWNEWRRSCKQWQELSWWPEFEFQAAVQSHREPSETHFMFVFFCVRTAATMELSVVSSSVF